MVSVARRMRKSAVLFIGLVAIVNAVSPVNLNEWEEFKDKYTKFYENGTKPYKMEINEFSDSTRDEFISRMFEYFNDINESNETIETDNLIEIDDSKLPEKVDWRDKFAVTPVGNQGRCNACWAFAAIGAIEGQYAIKKRSLKSFSVQSLVDCSTSNKGCDGGSPNKVFRDLVKGLKVPIETKYSKFRGKKQMCETYEDSGVRVKDFIKIKTGDEKALKKAIATIGPISVGVKIPKKFREFKSNEIYGFSECKTVDDTHFWHAMLIVGYGTDKKTKRDYYILKNSWGKEWGDNGYVKFARNHRNACRIADRASYPVFERFV